MKTPLLIFLISPDWLSPILTGGIIFLVVAVLAWLAISRYINPDTPELKKEAVTLLFQALGGTAFLLGVYFTWQQLVNSREELKNSREMLSTTQQGQITERFTRAIEQLGKEDEEGSETRGVKAVANPQKYLAIRLGGIYALERIARDYKPDHPAVMEVLTAFVRQHSALAEEQEVKKQEAKKPVQRDILPDIQALLTVIGRRGLTYKNGESQRLNLSGTDLRWAILNKAKLDGVDLTSAQLGNAQLKDAELREAILIDAHFTDAILEGAQLEGADLRGAVLRGAKVAGVNFKGANLSGADLSDAVGLTQEQLDSAKTDGATLTNLKITGKP
jgi:hypothetical protein